MTEYETTTTCPRCGHHSDTLDDFDTIGCCPGNLFCPRCHTEFGDHGMVHHCEPTSKGCDPEFALNYREFQAHLIEQRKNRLSYADIKLLREAQAVIEAHSASEHES